MYLLLFRFRTIIFRNAFDKSKTYTRHIGMSWGLAYHGEIRAPATRPARVLAGGLRWQPKVLGATNPAADPPGRTPEPLP